MRILILIMFLFLLNGCVPESDIYYRQYLIANNSGTTLNVKLYLFSDLIYPSEPELKDKDTLIGNLFSGSRPISEDADSNAPSSSLGDSIVLIFNNTKRQIYFLKEPFEDISEPVSRNLLRHGNYKRINEEQFIYTITPADFENAEDLD